MFRFDQINVDPRSKIRVLLLLNTTCAKVNLFSLSTLPSPTILSSLLSLCISFSLSLQFHPFTFHLLFLLLPPLTSFVPFLHIFFLFLHVLNNSLPSTSFHPSCLSPFLSSFFLSFYIPFCLSPCLPTHLSYFLPSFLPSFHISFYQYSLLFSFSFPCSPIKGMLRLSKTGFIAFSNTWG